MKIKKVRKRARKLKKLLWECAGVLGLVIILSFGTAFGLELVGDVLILAFNNFHSLLIK